MAFAWQTIHYPTLADYKRALLPFAVPSWIKGLTLHHTYRPTVDQWRGRRSMDALERYYRGTLHWPAGPHLFVAPDGLWAGTPLSTPGIHAGICNKASIGLEIVGDYDRQPWPVGLRELVYQLAVLLLQWAGLTEKSVAGHRECLANKSCPGAAIAMDLVRAQIGDRLFDQRFVVTVPAARVRMYPRLNSTQIGSATAGQSLAAHPTKGDLYGGSDRWARVRFPNSMIGYVWSGLGRFEPV